MKISFKEINNGLANEIFVKDELIGTVIIDSAYKAGKEMQRLHEMAASYNEYDEPFYDDTQDLDMRDMFKTLRIP